MHANATFFLSASVPDPKRTARFAETADTVAIASAVGALVHVLLGRRRMVWGGHPAITPMVYAIAEDMGVDYSQWVRLYQSSHFEDRYPEDNARFKNVVYTPRGEDLNESLTLMRARMFEENVFDAGVFIGGMEGVLDEYHLLCRLQPEAKSIPITSTGGATLDIANELGDFSSDLGTDLDYVSLLHRHLGISAAEARYNTPADQPEDLETRLLKFHRNRDDGS